MEKKTVALVFMTSLLVTSCLSTTVEIVSPQNGASVSRGRDLKITCAIRDLPDNSFTTDQLEWGRIASSIDVLIHDGSNYIIRNTTGNRRLTSELTITSVTYEDSGTYYCSWKYPGIITDYITVKVTGVPEIIDLYLDSYPIAGQDVVVVCMVQGRPFPSIEWRGPGSLTTTQAGTNYNVSTSSLSTVEAQSFMTLHSLTSQATGIYRCEAQNSQGTVHDDIDVYLDPWLSIFERDVGETNPPVDHGIVRTLGKASLLCKAYNIERSNQWIQWAFRPNGATEFFVVANNTVFSISSWTSSLSNDYSTLTSEIRFVANFTSQGTVRCRLMERGNAVDYFDRDLSVEDYPIVWLTPSSVQAAIGTEVDVTCTVQAWPKIEDIYWEKDYQRLSANVMRINDYTETVRTRIRMKTTDDFYSVITCYGVNDYGTATATVSIEADGGCQTGVCVGAHEVCVNTAGSYLCLCQTGYYRDNAGVCVTFGNPGTATPVPPFTWFPSATTSAYTTRSTSSTTASSSSSTSSTTSSTTTSRTTSENSGGTNDSNVGSGSASNVGMYAGVGGGAVGSIITVIVVVVLMRRRKQAADPEKCRRSACARATPTAPSSSTYTNPAFSPKLEGYVYTPLKRDRSEFPRDRLHLHEKLGQGKFGMVVRAMALSIQTNGRWDTVAVKMLKDTATDAEKTEIRRELALLRSLPRHQNVVMFLGCCTQEDPTLIIMEYCEQGDLLTYLRKRRPDKNLRRVTVTSDLTARDIFSFALHVARGMAHVASHKIVHRDVAARNVLISDRFVCKVSDFGLARHVDENSDIYEMVSKRPLPLRWMSPESLRDGIHTSQSDVWSYGVLLWELVTLGASPYPGSTGKAVIDLVVAGRQPGIPPQCTGELSDIMTSCWRMTPEERPTFDVIAGKFEKLLEQEGDYLMLDNLGEGIYSVLEPTASGERV